MRLNDIAWLKMVIMDTIFHYYYTVPKRVEDSDDDSPAPVRDLVIKKGPMSEGKKSVGFGDSKQIDKRSNQGTAKVSETQV